MPDLPVETESPLPLVPRFDTELGRYLWEPPAPRPIEPAFIHAAVEREFDPGPVRHDVTTFADTYPRGTKGSVSLAPKVPEAVAFDPLDDWRVDSAVADDILIALPDNTPRIMRTFLTLLLGAMRGRSRNA